MATGWKALQLLSRNPEHSEPLPRITRIRKINKLTVLPSLATIATTDDD